MTQRTPFICKKKEILEEKVAELQKSFTLSFFLTPCSMKKKGRENFQIVKSFKLCAKNTSKYVRNNPICNAIIFCGAARLDM